MVIYCRRGAQLRHPQVWDEDGYCLLPDAISHGIGSLLHPVAGYLILVPKLICLISLRISFFYFASVSTLLTWVFTALVCLAITFCPTWLRGRYVLGFFALLIPSDPECVGIPLYAFWWASLLLFLVVLWQNDSRDMLTRTTFLLLAGLSTPVIVLIPPLLLFRTIFLGNRVRNGFFFTVSLVCAGVQYHSIRQSPLAPANVPGVSSMLQIIPRFFGNYVLGNMWKNNGALWMAGFIAICLILLGLRWDRKKPVLFFLFYLCLGCMLMTAMRVPLHVIAPSNAGPRYFFFPFILISWLLVQIVVLKRSGFLRYGSVALLLLALINVFPVLSRNHHNLRWGDHVASAAHFPEYSIPVQFDGFGDPWRTTYSGKQVRELLASDWLATRSHLSKVRTFPFSSTAFDIDSIAKMSSGDSYATRSALAGPAEPFHNKAVPALAGFSVVGSYVQGNADHLAVTLHLHRGEKVVYCSGPIAYRQFVRIHNMPAIFSVDLPRSTQWSILDFSNDLLPSEFDATFSDRGRTPGEWFAIALKNTGP